MNKQNDTPFLKRTWVSSIGVFILSQIFFITCELIEWSPKFNDIGGTVLGKVTESSVFKGWFTFYETPNFNLITVFFVVVFFIPGVIGALKQIFSSKSYN